MLLISSVYEPPTWQYCMFLKSETYMSIQIKNPTTLYIIIIIIYGQY
jgi:hypothetical protein